MKIKVKARWWNIIALIVMIYGNETANIGVILIGSTIGTWSILIGILDIMEMKGGV